MTDNERILVRSLAQGLYEELRRRLLDAESNRCMKGEELVPLVLGGFERKWGSRSEATRRFYEGVVHDALRKFGMLEDGFWNGGKLYETITNTTEDSGILKS